MIIINLITLRRILLLIYISVFFSNEKIEAQKMSSANLSSAIKEFISSKKVVDNFKKCGLESDTLITLVDLNNILVQDSITQWKNITVSVQKTGLLLDSLKLYDAHFILKNRCNYYILRSRKEGKNAVFVTLQHACTNVVSSVRIIQRGHVFSLGEIKNGVW